MRASASKLSRWTILALGPLGVSLLSMSARADDTAAPAKTGTPPSQDAARSDSPDTTSSGIPAPPPPPPTTFPTATTFIERLPPESFPNDPIRGIDGGSLKFNFHGKEWPYYPKTGIGVSGYVWLDSGYEHMKLEGPGETSYKYAIQQGRLVLRVTPTWSDGKFFVQGQAELVGNENQTQAQPYITTVDDLWIKAGQWGSWDFQIGRFYAWELYHFGLGLDLFTLEFLGAQDKTYSVPAIYGVTTLYYLPASAGDAAFHWYATKNLRFEALSQYGNQLSSNTIGARAAIVYDVGWMKIKGGAEYARLSDSPDGSPGYTKNRGAGGAIQFVADPRFEAGVNGAYGLQDEVSSSHQVSETGSFHTFSLGGFANVRVVDDLLVGAGYNYTFLQDINYDPVAQRDERYKHTQTYVAVQYKIAKQLFVKAVAGYAVANLEPKGVPIFNDVMMSGRLRLQYLF